MTRLLPPLYKYYEFDKYAGKNIDNFECEIYGLERLDEIDVSLFRQQILPEVQEYASKPLSEMIIASTNTGKQRWTNLIKQAEYSKELENTLQFFSGKESLNALDCFFERQFIKMEPPSEFRQYSPSCTTPEEAEVTTMPILEKSVERKSTQKPKLTFTNIIALALLNSERGQLHVQDIYAWITQEFPYFETAEKGWKNSVRHSLSKSNMFTKIVIPSLDFIRNFSYWSIIPEKMKKIKLDLAAQAEKNKIDEAIQRHYTANPPVYPVKQYTRRNPTEFKAVKLQDPEDLAAVNAIENNFMESLAEHNSTAAAIRRVESFPKNVDNSQNISPNRLDELGSFFTKRPAILSRSTAKRPISSVSGHRISTDTQFAKKQSYDSRPKIIDPSSISLF